MAEFDCCECGRHIISYGFGSDRPPEPPLCAACLMIPGWPSIPELRERLGLPEPKGDGEDRSRETKTHEEAFYLRMIIISIIDRGAIAKKWLVFRRIFAPISGETLPRAQPNLLVLP